MYRMKQLLQTLALAACISAPGAAAAQSGETVDLTDAQVEELVRRSYQYVAMFNVNNKFALDPDNPMTTGGYNRTFASTELADHTLQAIARPNNDTLYTIALIDVTEEPVVLKMPAFDSTYVSLMVTAYDHYVNIARAGCGIHLTMPMALPPPGADSRKGLTDREQANLGEQAFLQAQETGYQRIQGTKPQTLDYGLHD
jgi:hypothetical protein